MSATEILMRSGVPDGMILRQHRDGLTPALVKTLRTMQMVAENEGVVDRDAFHIDGDEIAFTLSQSQQDGLMVAAATCYQMTDGGLLLQFLYVDPLVRRRGCAMCLWQCALALAGVMQCTHLSSISKPDNRPMAALYAKVGAPVTAHIHQIDVKGSPT